MKNKEILKRKLYGQLLTWKQESQGSTAVMIDGARRVGKSYLCQQFAQNEYKSHIIVDFGNAAPEIQDLFLHETANLDLFFAKLSAYYGTLLEPRQSVIIFDEVQQFPRARQLVKYLVADGRFDYIETGSLIRLKKNVQDIIIPSEEEHLSCTHWILKNFSGPWAIRPPFPSFANALKLEHLWGKHSIEKS